MKKTVIVFIFLIGVIGISAQEVVSSGGETQQAGRYEISWTIGEPVIETISTGAYILTQGFHQPGLTVTPVNEIEIANLELKVYPNPTSEYILIQLNKLENDPAFSLYSIKGKLLVRKSISKYETSVDLKNYASGSYLLKISQARTQMLQTFKIIKE